MRLKPRFNETINKWWICDEGRYGYKFHDHNRVTRPMVREKGSVRESSWHEVLPQVAKRIQEANGKIGVFISPQLSNEEIYLAKKLFENIPGIFLVSPNPPGFQDDLLIRSDKTPNSKGAEFLGLSYDDKAVSNFFSACGRGEMEGIVVFGQDLLTLHGPHLAASALDRLKWSVFIGSNHNLMSEYAAFVLPAATYAEKEGTFTNFEGRVQKFEKALDPLGDSLPEWQILIRLAKQMKIHLHYDRAGEIFEELVLKATPFRGLSYEKLGTGGSDIRSLAAPVIPALEQEAGIL